MKRIRKDNAAIVLFGSEPFSSHLRMSNIKEFKYDWIWKKNFPSNHFNAKLMPLKIYETVSVFSDGKTANCNKNNMRYFPQGIKPSGKKHTNSGGNELLRKRPSHKPYFIQTATGYPTTVIEFDGVKNKSVHPTQKPVALIEYLIKTYTLEGETVLDFTMGSGSTGVAAKNLGRSFIGIEKDVTYYDIATKRIYETLVVKV